VLDEGKGLGKILEPIDSFDPGCLVQQRPIQRLSMILFGGLTSQRRDAAAARCAAFFGE
jgi:hypothetical protein